MQKCRYFIKQLINKYKSLSVQLKAAFWFMICNFVQKGISLISVPIFTRILTADQYGMFNVYQSWSSMIQILATLMLVGGVYNKGLIKFEDDKERFSSSLLGLSTTTTFILFAVYLLFHNRFNVILGFESPYATLIMIALFLELFGSPALGFWSVQQRFYYKYAVLICVTLVMAILNPALGIFAVTHTSLKGEARIFSTVLVDCIVFIVFYVRIFSKGKTFYNKEYWKYALAFNLPLIPHYLSQTVLLQSDRLMINNICGTDKAGIYSVAYSLAMVMNLVTNSINSTLIPWSYQKIHSHKEKDIVPIANVVLTMVGVLSLIVVAFAPELMKIYASPEYGDAIWVIPPLSLNVFLTFLYTLFVNIEFYYEESKFIMVASMSAAVINILLNYVFINSFGYLAAGYISAACYVLLCIAHYEFMKRTLKRHNNAQNIYDGRFIFCYAIALIGITGIFLLTYRNIVARYLLLSLIICLIIVKRNVVLKSMNLLFRKE